MALHLPPLPTPPSWFPGHMMKFTRMLPALLKRTNVVLEIRDSRLPLTSINRTLEGESDAYLPFLLFALYSGLTIEMGHMVQFQPHIDEWGAPFLF